MPNYQYSAMNEVGRKIRGAMTAVNEVDLEDRLKQIGLELLIAKEAKEKKGIFGPGSVKLKDMIVLCHHLEQLDRAGVPLLDAIADVRDSAESPRLKEVLAEVYEAVKGGEMLSKALTAHPKVFNDVFVGLIGAGEKTGDLAGSFHNLSHHLKWTADIRRKVKKAVTYPVMLLLVVSAVIVTLMVVLVPKLVGFMTAQGFDLPIHTRALIATSDFVQAYWPFVLGFPIVVGVGLVACYRASDAFAYRIDEFFLRLPVMGPTIRKINMARFTHFFGVMYKSGIDILDALDASQKVVGNRVLREAITTARRSVSGGNSLTASLRVSNQFPTLVIRMFKVGEDSGNMNEAVENITFFYDREVNDAVDGMVALIQPALTIILGLIILWIVAAMFGPLYQSFSKMKI